MKTYKETLQSVANGLSDFTLDDNESWVIKNRFLNNMDKGDEADFVENLYFFMSLGSLHEENHDDYKRYYRLINYFTLMFHGSDKVRTLVSGFYKTQDNICSWYEFSKPLLRQWGIWKSAT